MNETEISKLLPKIAHLYYLEDMNQDEIAGRLNINRVRVSRYLKKARENKVVEIKINYSKESHQELERLIEKKYSLKECIIIPAHENRMEILREMATTLTSLLLRVAKDGDTVGVNWGITLKEVAALMDSAKKLDITVVPIVGGIGRIEMGIHTNSIAKTFADVFGGTSYVINAPAILDSKKTKDILMCDSNTREIFELLENMKCTVFSFSDLGPESSYEKFGLMDRDEIEYLKKLGAVGDVNLDFLNKQGEHIPNRFNDRVIALPVSKIRKTKNVIGIACGSRKSEITLAVLRGKIVNILIIDKELADSVLSIDDT
jgi:DNA-binding transcriptional regulator LsrR (DeoR family)